ncbi:hypothetical protein GON26_20490 [Flavobacterium sp. GA093]|uniref:Uncharacterized protein n=1 Tax=Flavobacterium hydrocarbonoxydans TaxID=2683249 RepID=A0A6I4P0K1_9FLAO|nr:hypothetical protein [Flavobacterium hydrocarbonoxydans]MWB96747.1 hypothetical protein [Flavobacterium hydrocarbonoxydans]
MTPHNELFVKIKQALITIPSLELIDLQRRQFLNPEVGDPVFWTAALIDVKSIAWQNLSEGNQEGDCKVEVILYCKKGWAEQLNVTVESEDELAEYDLVQKISEKIQRLKGDLFTSLLLIDEKAITQKRDNAIEGYKGYRLTFDTTICRLLSPNPVYTKRHLDLTIDIKKTS